MSLSACLLLGNTLAIPNLYAYVFAIEQAAQQYSQNEVNYRPWGPNR